MPVRLTVGTLMLGVALAAVVLAAGRVHLSLGSLAFGILSIAWVRAARWAERRRAGGEEVRRLGVAGAFFAEVGPAAVTLVAAFLPAVVVVVVLYAFVNGRSHSRISEGDVAFITVAGGLASAWTLRALRPIKKP